VDFTYPGDVHFSFTSTQFGVDGMFDAGLRLFGDNGSANVPYSGAVQITGKEAWAWQDSTGTAAGTGSGMKFAANGAFSDNLAFADRDKERTFIDSITSGNLHNQIAAGVETALSCMLGRMAGLTGREVTWDELLTQGRLISWGLAWSSLGEVGVYRFLGCVRIELPKSSAERLFFQQVIDLLVVGSFPAIAHLINCKGY